MKSARTFAAVVGYALLMVAACFFARHGAPEVSGHAFTRPFIAFMLLFAPLWFFGFGGAEPLKRSSRSARVAGAATLALPYFVFTFGTPDFYWRAAVISIALPVLLVAFLALPDLPERISWRDATVLGIIVTAHFLRWADLWPAPAPGAFPKLFLADIALYCFLIGRRIEGMGYSLIPTRSAFLIGFREWLFYFPIAVLLGEGTGFIHFHRIIPHLSSFFAAILITSLLIALPEELFFRGILQNLLETRLGRNSALIAASILFGLSHFSHGSAFNWRYVLLASVAGIFYGRAWRANRHIFAAVVTHTAVDVVWSLWFR
jgi:uncharacterized protein